MTRLLAISGSLRSASYNTALLRAAQALIEPPATLAVATLHGIPLYDGDLEAREGIPGPVQELKQRIVETDGLILASPEYNQGIPGVFKNTIDWLSRPPEDIARIFQGRPVALIGASPGGFGTILAQNAWLGVLHALGTRHWSGGRLLASRANRAIDEQGKLVDAALREQLAQFLRGFVAFAQAQGGR